MISIKTASLAISLAVLTSAANAQAIIQYSDGQGYGYRTEPLYPYAPPQRATPRPETRAAAQPAKKVDAALVAELRNKRKPGTQPKASVEVVADEQTAPQKRKPKAKAGDVTASIDKTVDNKKITKTVVVREKPIVRKTYRVVEHPPIVVQREVSEDQVGAIDNHAQAVPQPAPVLPQGAPVAGRTIRAEAEITILGPDRMSIRLFRRQDGIDANAKVTKPKPALKRSAGADSKTKIR